MTTRKQDKTAKPESGDKDRVIAKESLDTVDATGTPNAPGVGAMPGGERPGTGRGSIPGSGMGGGGSPGKENEPGIHTGHRGNKHKNT